MPLAHASSLQATTLALAGAAAALLPDDAEACTPDECAGVDVWRELAPLNAAAIPTDGVLVLYGLRYSVVLDSEADWLDAITVTVTRDGQPIAGGVEAPGIRGVLLWRPAAPLEPGEYAVVGSLDNPEPCGTHLALDFEFSVAAEPSEPLSPPKVDTSAVLSVRGTTTFEDLVCCDGAMPFTAVFDCPSQERIEWSEGFCASRQGFGVLRVDVSITTDLPPATDALVVREMLVDGEPQGGDFLDLQSVGEAKPFCTAVRLTNLATGEVVETEETCHGDDPETAAQLGIHAVDPGEALAMQCSESAYTCERHEDGDRWDPANCSPWPADAATGGEPTEGSSSDGPGGESSDSAASGGADEPFGHGCACDDRPSSGPPGALVLLGLGLLRRRRRITR
ncbi:hypothetical protein [Nannocystis pusilla]|uniref:MYXO-CTERM domain-containing protein n=1 Tax=Nannocystis pusilla TaxID=889268 RepID=A0ABS7TK37_9BACT|nr:hypothetical protein [Nannocystis pusilla]MBZ5708598.1 hypothetical protein [Nannocystis pusilla]